MSEKAQPPTWHTPPPENQDEEWQAAGLALISRTPPDPKPLAALLREALRNGRPIPAGTIELLAELLDPQEPEYLFCALILVSTVANGRKTNSKSPTGTVRAGFRRHTAIRKRR